MAHLSFFPYVKRSMKVVYERCENSSWLQVHAHAWSGEQRFRDFLVLLSLLSLCCSIRQMTKICFSFFGGITIIRVIFSCSYCWTVLKFDYSWLLASQLNYFEVCIFFKAKSLYSATVVCFFIGSINSECNKHFFSPYCRLTTGIHHSSHATDHCWQCFFYYLEWESFCQHYDKQGWIQYWPANGAEMFHISVSV